MNEDAYYRARLAAHRAWARSQPQLVVPGVLEQADGEGFPSGPLGTPSACSSPPPDFDLPLGSRAGGLVDQTKKGQP